MSKFDEKKDELLRLFNEGLSNRQIAKELEVHHSSVSNWLKKLNISRSQHQQPIEIIDENNAKCSKCNEIKPLNEFQFGRKGTDQEYRFSYCNSCRKKQTYDNLNSDYRKFIKNSFQKLKRRANTENIPFDLTYEYIIDMYEELNGECFYSNSKMILEVGKGHNANSLSFDKIIPEIGYVEGNVVLCSNRFNTIKSDLSLEELKIYTPMFYEKICNSKFINKKLLNINE